MDGKSESEEWMNEKGEDEGLMGGKMGIKCWRFSTHKNSAKNNPRHCDRNESDRNESDRNESDIKVEIK